MANMVAFVDPKRSWKAILQNIGRICRRKSDALTSKGTVLLPVALDRTHFEGCTSREDRDRVIREQMNATTYSDWSGVLNVMAAVGQEDEVFFSGCLLHDGGGGYGGAKKDAAYAGGTSPTSSPTISSEKKVIVNATASGMRILFDCCEDVSSISGHDDDHQVGFIKGTVASSFRMCVLRATVHAKMTTEQKIVAFRDHVQRTGELPPNSGERVVKFEDGVNMRDWWDRYKDKCKKKDGVSPNQLLLKLDVLRKDLEDHQAIVPKKVTLTGKQKIVAFRDYVQRTGEIPPQSTYKASVPCRSIHAVLVI
jgi:hypothetical protein